MSSSVTRLAKPQLRGHLRKEIRFHFIMAFTFGTSCALAWKVFVSDARKKAYAEYHKTYDIVKHRQRLEELGYLDNPFKGDFDDED